MSDRLKLATTVALAIAIAYWVALSLNWQRPYWAGLAVGMIGVSTFGESIYKGLQRISGTAVGVVVAIALISFFAQDRWYFGLAVSGWLAFCMLMMLSHGELYYFWYCAGFIAPLLSLMSGFESAQSFYIVMTRAQETVLGVICFVLVALIISPSQTHNKFRETLIRLIKAMREFTNKLSSLGDARSDQKLRLRISQDLMALKILHAASQLESIEVRQHDRSWLELVNGIRSINGLLDRLALIKEQGPDEHSKSRLTASLASALSEIEARLGATAELLSAHGDYREPRDFDIAQVPVAGHGLSTFELGEGRLRNEILSELDRVTRLLNMAAADVAGKIRHKAEVYHPRVFSTWLPDPEHLAITLRQVVAFWIAFLTYIYVPDLPGGPMLVILSATLGFNLSRMPWVPSTQLIPPILVAATFGAVTHVLIMPHLSGFGQLAALLFSGVFLIVWLFPTDQLQAGRFISVVLFLLTQQTSNVGQAYSFTYILNMVVALLLILLILAFAQRAPVSFKPERVVERLFRRYASSLVAVLEGMRWDLPSSNSWLARQRRAYHMNQLMTLPVQIDLWSRKLSKDAASDSDKASLVQLAQMLDVISYRLADLAQLKARSADEVWLGELGEVVRAWRTGIQEVVRLLRDTPGLASINDMRGLLDAKLASIEATVSKTARAGTEGAASIEGVAHMQRVLAAYRGLSLAVLDAAGPVRKVSWGRLNEARF